MSCFGDCLDMGPPPDSILFMPPPPLPSFLQLAISTPGPVNESAPPCAVALMCELTTAKDGQGPGVEYVELPRQGPSVIDDTWLLVLISSCVGVLLLGALLALFLLKCREAYTLHYSSTNTNKQPALSADSMPTLQNKSRPLGTTEAVLYPCSTSTGAHHLQSLGDSRVLWAALTPRGTQHFISENYPQDYVADSYREDNHYETIENFNLKPSVDPYSSNFHHITAAARENISFDNSGFVDYDYEDPTPLIESYQMDDIESCYQEPEINPYCMISSGEDENMGSLRRGTHRPLVSSPTRIENPNLPPLNLHPHRPNNNTLRKSTLCRRVSDTNSFGGPI